MSEPRIDEIKTAMSEPAPHGDFDTLRDKIRAEKAWRQRRYAAYRALLELASEAASKARAETQPTTMIVEEHANQLDDRSPVVNRWTRADGSFGWAQVRVFNRKNRSFGIWLGKQPGWSPHYRSGHALNFGIASYERQAAAAAAYAATLRSAGIEAYSHAQED